jgi:DNA-binding IclR family transcriptional regulator
VIPSEVVEFIQSSVKSVWSAELLLFLRRRPERGWTGDELIRELRSSRSVVAEILATFLQAGLVTEEGGMFRYAPASTELDRVVGELERVYTERPTAVVKAIMAAPSEKLQIFADAFRIKKD